MTQNYLPWYLERGHGPLLAVALHDGHGLRDELMPLMALPEGERLREEDPFTGEWTKVAPTRVVALQSRFELDLNRPRDKAIYRSPEDAWGLQVWNRSLPSDLVGRSYAVYDSFYQEMQGLLQRMTMTYGRIVVLDIHSYNHRRDGENSPEADAYANPEINVGTGTMIREPWSPVIERFITDMRNFDFLGHHLDVRENVKFKGGHFAAWAHANFPNSVCVLSIEVKKFFMDEWTGVPDVMQIDAVMRALKSAIWGVYEELVKMNMPQKKALS